MPKVVPEYKEEAKARILKTATEMFVENGYKILFRTNKEVEKKKIVNDWYSGALYSLYKVEDCKLRENVPLTDCRRHSCVLERTGWAHVP